MITLGIDTCFGACSVAIVECSSSAGRAVITHENTPMARGHAEALMPMLARALDKLGSRSIDRIGVTCGPGTFTGTRVGLAVARALALAWQVPTVGVGTLEAMAVTAIRNNGDLTLPLAVLRDARRGQVYVQVFETRDDDGCVHACCDAEIVACDAVEAYLPHDVRVVLGSGGEAVAWDKLQPAQALPHLEPDALAVCEIAAAANPDDVPARPIYLRPPDAKPQEAFALPRRGA